MFDEQITVEDENGIVALYYPRGRVGEVKENSTKFLTPDEIPLQVGLINRSSGYEFKAHTHSPVERTIKGCPETLIILEGELIADIYNEHGKFLQSLFVEVGIFLQIRGGHRFTVNQSVSMVEVKQGPYVAAEKVFFDPSAHEQTR